MLYRSINPATGEQFAEYPELENKSVERILAKSQAAYSDWKATSLEARAAALLKLAKLVEDASRHLAPLLTNEMGKPLALAEAELSRVASVARYYAENAAGILGEEILDEVKEKQAVVRHDPLGVVLAITPWNYPASLLARAALPALIAGDTVLLKPAPNVAGISLALERLFLEAGLPEGVFQVVLLSNEQAGSVIEDSRIRMVSFTGSVAAGREIGRRAGGALKKVTLELGGNDAFIVRRDADPLEAARAAVTARTNNAGQICCAPKRFLVHSKLLKQFTDEAQRMVESIRVGDPLNPESQMGPLARRDLRDNLKSQVEALVKAGAEVGARSSFPADKGFFYPATVLRLKEPLSLLNHEELFGPVLPVLPFETDKEAVQIANSTPFGLAASIFGQDRRAIGEMAAGLECGVVCVNCGVAVDPRMPFGGVKDSGFGRTYGREGLRENTNSKTVVFPRS